MKHPVLTPAVYGLLFGFLLWQRGRLDDGARLIVWAAVAVCVTAGPLWLLGRREWARGAVVVVAFYALFALMVGAKY